MQTFLVYFVHLCAFTIIVTTALGESPNETESRSMSFELMNYTLSENETVDYAVNFPAVPAPANQPCVCYPATSTLNVHPCSCYHNSCTLLGENYDVDYKNKTFCAISPITNNNPYSTSTTPTVELICPFDDMVISRLIFARWAKYYLPGPTKCQSSSGKVYSKCSVPLSDMLSTLTPLCVGLNRCTVPTTYSYWNHIYKMPSSCEVTLPLVSQIFTSFSFQCVKAPSTNCYLYDTFCHAFRRPAPITGGIIKWEQPYTVNLGGSLSPSFTQACNGLISDDYHCLQYHGGSVS